MRVVDQSLPAGTRLPVEVVVLQRIAEHAERTDDDIRIADRVANFCGEARNVLAVKRLPEEGLNALEAERDDLPDIAGDIVKPRPHHCSYTNILRSVRQGCFP